MEDKERTQKLKIIWDKYLKLNMSDRTLCEVSQDLFRFLFSKHSDVAIFGHIPKHLSGSSKDGAAIARWFKNCGETLIEWDIMFNIARIYCNCRGTVDEISKPGYVSVRCVNKEGRGYCIFSSNDEAFEQVLRGNGNINGESVKNVFEEYLKQLVCSPESERKIEEAFKKVLDGGSGEITVEHKGVSIFFQVENKKKKICFQCDNIASIYCQINWPERAEHWKDFEDHKNMTILTGEEAEKIQNSGCHVIPKTLPDDDEAWRWSLSKAESAVVQHLTPQQHIAYLICKVLFYNRLSKLGNGDDQELTSFMIKNSMFNIFSDTGSEYDRYNSNAKILYDVIPLTITLLKYVRDALLQNPPTLKHFFLKGVNVLHHISPSFGNKVASELQYILDNITNPNISVPCNIDRIIEEVNKIKKREQSYEKSNARVKFDEKTKIMHEAMKIPKSEDILFNGLEKIKRIQQMFKDVKN